MINAERLFREHFKAFLNSSALTDTPYYSTCSWNSIEDYLRSVLDDHRFDINVEPHRSKSNLAWYDYRYPRTINLNSKKMYRSDESIAGSIAHEFTHMTSRLVRHESFSHPSLRFWRKKKVLNSAPYVIGREFKKYLLELKNGEM